MEKTIKEELERKIISSELLNDNSLLITSSNRNDEYPTVSVRYIDNDVIREDRIATLLPTIAIQHNESMVAVFIINQDQKEDTLITVYDLDDHSYVENDFLKTVYNSKLEHGKPMQYIKPIKSQK